MYVRFTAATGRLVQSHKILGWSFSNSNFSFSEGLIATGLPSFVLASDSIVESKGFIAGVTVGRFVRDRIKKDQNVIWENLGYWF
ncbi:L-type lectin-domain containing receptor kinase VII.1 [Linum perenne]